jgi:hypothetical protein
MPITLALPAVWKILLYLVSGIVGIVGCIVLGKFLARWGNQYKDSQNIGTTTDGRTQTEKDDQAANKDSDALKKIEGR